MSTKKNLVKEATVAINENKLQEMVLNQVTKSLSKGTKEVTPKAEEAKVTKTTKEAVLKVEPKAKKVSKKKVEKEVTEINKTNLIEKVISNREVKYLYPEDCIDTLSRKSWRQKVRNRLHSLEMAMHRIQDQSSKEFKAAKQEYDKFKLSISKQDTAI